MERLGYTREVREVGDKRDWRGWQQRRLKAVGNQAAGSAQARPGSLCPGLGEGDTEAGTALSREGHLETGIGRFRRKQV